MLNESPCQKELALHITVTKDSATLNILSFVQPSAKDIWFCVDYRPKRLEMSASVKLAGINLFW